MHKANVNTESLTPAGGADDLAQSVRWLDAQINDFGITLETARDLYSAAVAVSRVNPHHCPALLIAIDRYMGDLEATKHRLAEVAAKISACMKGGA